MTGDDVWARWQADIREIELDAYELFTIRRQFREIATMFEQNPALPTAGANLWLFLRGMYASTVLMKMRREVDAQDNTINLRALLREIEQRADVVTRARILERIPRESAFLVPHLDEAFTSNWRTPSDAPSSPEDSIDRSLVTRDRAALETATNKLVEITSRTIAHRQRVAPEKSVRGVESVFALLELLIIKYGALLTGRGLDKLEPTPQYDTTAPFMFPWHPRAYDQWIKFRSAQQQDGDDGDDSE